MTPQEIYIAMEKNPALTYHAHTGEDITVELASVPVTLHRGLVAYMLLGIEPGRFLKAVIANDFRNAALKADHVSKEYLAELARFRESAMPDACQGSYQYIKEWCDRGGLIGREDAV